MNRTLLLLLLSPAIASAVPLQFTHQGRLFDAAGAPLTSDHQLTVALYDAASGGAELWREVESNVPFDNGYYSLILGDTTPLSASSLSADTIWLSLAVDGAPPIAARVPLTSVPFALNAAHADTATLATAATSADNATNAAHADTATRSDTAAAADTAATADNATTAAHATAATRADTAAVADTIDWSGIANVPVGTTASTIAAGDHTHTADAVGALSLAGGELTGELLGTNALFTGEVMADAVSATTLSGQLAPGSATGRLCAAGTYFAMGHCLPKGTYTPQTACTTGSLYNGVCYSWPSGGNCQQLTLRDTVNNCAGLGGRVCTVAELDRLDGTGCGMDLVRGWANFAETYDNKAVFGLCVRAPSSVNKAGGVGGDPDDSIAGCEAVQYGEPTADSPAAGYAICCFD